MTNLLVTISKKSINLKSKTRSSIFKDDYDGMMKFRANMSIFPRYFNSETEKNILREYIKDVKDNLTKCKKCETMCCSWCQMHNAVHNHEECKNWLYEKIEKKHRTWRRFFKNEKIQDHEKKHINGVFRMSRLYLSENNCPCSVIVKNLTENEYNIFIALAYYKQATLLEHAQILKEHN